MDAKNANKVRDIIETVLAIEMLEYHDQNFLSGDMEFLNVAKRKLLMEGIKILGTSAVCEY